jgi:hypothetical protein
LAFAAMAGAHPRTTAAAVVLKMTRSGQIADLIHCLKSKRDSDKPVKARAVSDLCVEAFDNEFLTGMHCFFVHVTADGLGLIVQHST